MCYPVLPGGVKARDEISHTVLHLFQNRDQWRTTGATRERCVLKMEAHIIFSIRCCEEGIKCEVGFSVSWLLCLLVKYKLLRDIKSNFISKMPSLNTRFCHSYLSQLQWHVIMLSYVIFVCGLFLLQTWPINGFETYIVLFQHSEAPQLHRWSCVNCRRW